MVPINGRPVIGWILDNLSKRGLTDIAVLTSHDDRQIVEYLERAYKGKRSFNITCFPVEDPAQTRGLGHSVYEGLRLIANGDSALLLILGHTIFEGELALDGDAVLCHAVTEEVSRWCYVETDERGFVRHFIDKPEKHPLPADALIGIYYLTHRAALLDCLHEVIYNRKEQIAGRFELSSALEIYKKQYPIRAVRAAEWLDCGSVAGIHRSRRALIAARAFNSVTVDEHLGVVTKRSRSSSKLYHEFAWYSSLPKELKVLTPRVLDWKLARDGDEAELQLEYYGYNLLSEAWVYQNLHAAVWFSIINHLLEITARFRKYLASVPREDFEAIYWTKTISRLAELRMHTPERGEIDWASLFTYNDLRINSKLVRGYEMLEPSIRRRVPTLYREEHATIIHGDFHFGNILYDVNSRLMKLIDARGNFGTGGIFGDCKYDLAKLRHSVSGGYDLIVNDLFVAKAEGNELTLRLSYPPQQQSVARFLDTRLIEEGFQIQDIKLIEGLLFLSMLPLHSDRSDRQLAMFIQAMTILNEVFSP